MTADHAPRRASGVAPRAEGAIDWRRAVLHAFLIVISIVWLFPLVWAVYTSLRPYEDTARPGTCPCAGHAQPRQLRQRLEPAPSSPATS